MQYLKRLLTYVKGYTGKFIIAGIMMSIVAACAGGIPYLIKYLTNEVLINKNMQMFKIIPFLFVGLFIIKGVASYVQGYIMTYIGQDIIRKIRNKLYEKMILLSLDFYTKERVGNMISRITNDVMWLQRAVTGVIMTIIRDSLTVVALVGVLISFSWQMSIMTLIGFPLISFFIVRISKRLRKYSRISQEEMGSITSKIQETLSGIRIVKAFLMERMEMIKFKRYNLNYFTAIMKNIKIGGITSPLMEILGALGGAIVIIYGGYQIIYVKSSTMTAGTFYGFITAMFLIYEPIKRLSNSNNILQQAMAAAERIFEIIDSKPTINEKENAVQLNEFQKNIKLNNVSFSYEKETQVLKNINLTVNKGEMVAVVGPSGVGKTTLTDLIPRFYDVTEGELLIDGINVKDYNIVSLRKRIGLVSQEVILFNDTLKNNISYGNPNASMEQIEHAAKVAYVDEIVKKLPDGYDTIIGDRGVRLSGGERQRISIARVILKNPPIMILDEATSSLDTESEKVVQAALDNLVEGRTTIVIAHRLSTVIHSDKIIVLDNGSICSIGKHDELLNQSALYKRLYELQFNI